MSNGRKLLFVFSFLIIDILLVGSILVMKEFTGKNILKNEVNALAELDFTKDKYNSDIKSNGEYAVVEEAIKKYLDDYSTEVQNCLRVRYDQKLNNMLTIDNYINDGPLFEESLEYIETLRVNFNYNVDLLMERVTEKEINEYIYGYEVDEDSANLYSNLLLESNLISKINENQLALANKRIMINSYIDTVYNTLTLLKDNAYSYEIIDNKIVFNAVIIENEYYDLINKAKRIYD